MLHLETAALTGDAAERERELRAASQALRQAKELQQKSRAAFGTY